MKLQKFGCEGGVLFIKEHAVKITVPAGAIIKGDIVQLVAAAGPFGKYSIPEGYHPISVYVLLEATDDYLFRKKLKVEIEHDSVVSEDTDISKLCVLTTSKKGLYHGQKLLEMHEDTCEYQYEVSESTCTLFIDHFCSKCLASTDTITIPKRVMIYHYLPEEYKSKVEFVCEISICFDLTFCKKVVAQNNHVFKCDSILIVETDMKNLIIFAMHPTQYHNIVHNISNNH